MRNLQDAGIFWFLALQGGNDTCKSARPGLLSAQIYRFIMENDYSAVPGDEVGVYRNFRRVPPGDHSRNYGYKTGQKCPGQKPYSAKIYMK